MMPQNETTVGIDVSKAWIDVAWPDGSVERVETSPAALRKLARRLRLAGIVHAGLEPTGGYERGPAAALRAEAITVLSVDSWRCRQFAKARGVRAKTDPIDARMIGAFMLAHPCRPLAEPGEAQAKLTAWVREARRAEDDVRRLKNRSEHGVPADIQSLRDAEIATLEATVAAAERAIETLIAGEAGFAQKAAIVTSVPGLAIKSARALMAELPELGGLGARAAAALAGLAPYRRDSGRSEGPARIQAGRAALRRACYLAAFAAIRHNPWAERVYRGLRNKGKPAKVAIVAVARRIVVILDAMIRDNTKWRPEKHAPA